MVRVFVECRVLDAIQRGFSAAVPSRAFRCDPQRGLGFGLKTADVLNLSIGSGHADTPA